MIYDYEKIETGSCYDFSATQKLGACLTIHAKEGDVELEYITHKMRFFLNDECCAIATPDKAAAILVVIKNWHKQWPSTDLPCKYEVIYNIGLVLGKGCDKTVELKDNVSFNTGIKNGIAAA